MHDQRNRFFSEDERRGWRGREERAEGSWRDHGDGGNFEPSRGRWDDDRRYTRSRQDQFDEDDRYDASYGNDGRYGYRGPSASQSQWTGGMGGFGGSYGRGAGRYSDVDRGYRAFDRYDRPWTGDRGSHASGRWNREYGSSTDTNEPSYAGRGPKDYQRSDERIREEISDRLTDDHRVDASDVVVEVRSCEVTLSGTVNDREQKRRAEDLAESVSGVREVTNQLRVAKSDDRANGRGYQASGRTSTSGNKPKSGSRLP